jgi:hypothetical protein
LKLVDRLGYTEQQYEVGLAKLDQRYGGGRRLLQRYLDAIMSFPEVGEDNLLELEELSNRLCDLVVKLADSQQEQELSGTSALYTMVLQKIPDSLLILYQNQLTEVSGDGLAVFADWLDRQVNIRIELNELKKRSSTGKRQTSKQQRGSSHTINTDNAESKPIKADKKNGKRRQESQATASTTPLVKTCPLCRSPHSITSCRTWKQASPDERWAIAKEKILCFRCLDGSHLGAICPASTKCSVEDCPKTHHPSLHPTKKKSSSTISQKTTNLFGVSEEGMVRPTRVGLRVIPVLVCGKGRMKVRVPG